MGYVVSAEGAPVTDFVVTLHNYIEQTAVFGRQLLEQRFQSEDGSFTLTGVNEGRYGVKARATGFAGLAHWQPGRFYAEGGVGISPDLERPDGVLAGTVYALIGWDSR